jgi:hypothetical protein
VDFAVGQCQRDLDHIGWPERQTQALEADAEEQEVDIDIDLQAV